MNIAETPITELIPQRSPFVMVDKLQSCETTDAVTTFLMREDDLFCEDGRLSAPGMLENMAQSCAARMGWLCKTHNEGIKIGVIGEIRGCKFVRHPVVGELITTHIHIIEDVFNFTLATATMKVGEEVIAGTTMKIALVDTPTTKHD